MTFRGQNYLSSAIRRVGRDIGTLSRTQQLTAQRGQLQINQRRLQTQRLIAANELNAINSGSRSLNIQRAKAQLDNNEFVHSQKIRRNYEQQLGVISQSLQQQTKIEQLTRAQATGKPVGRGLSRLEPAQIQRNLQAAYVAQERLLNQGATLRAEEEQLTSTLSTQSIAAQQVAAREAEMFQRRAVLIEQLKTLDGAEELNTIKLKQNAVAMSMLPWEKFERGSRAVEHAGRVIQMFGLISTAVFGYAAEQAAKFSTQSVLAATQVVDAGNKSIKNVQQVGAGINQALGQFLASGQTTAKPEELSAGIYRIYSSISLPGNQKQRVKEGIGLLKEFNQVLTANYGMVSFNDVIDAGVRIINNFDRNLKDVPRDLNTMQAAVRYGNLNMAEFISTLNQAAPAGKAAGYSFNQVASTIAFLSRTLSPRFAAAGYARLTELLSKNAAQFRTSGIEVEKAGGGLRDINVIIDEMLKKFPKLGTGQLSVTTFLKNITGTQGYIQARRALTQLLTNPQGAKQLQAQITGDLGELARSAAAAGISPGVAWAKFSNQLRGMVLLIGQGAIPAFIQLSKPIERMIAAFDKLSPHAQRFIGYLGVIVSVGALAGGTLMTIVGGLGVVASAIGKMIRLGGEGGLLGRIFGGGALAGEAGSASIGVALSLGLVAAIPLLIMYHKQVMMVINALGGLHKVMLVIALVAGIMISARAIRGLQTLSAEALIARDSVVALRLGLAALATVGTIIITIDIVKQLIDKYLPGLNEKPFSPKADTVGSYAAAAAASKQAIANTKAAVKQATPAYRKAVREAEDLFTKGLNPTQVANRLQKDRPALAKKLAEGLGGPISDALVLFKAYSKGRSNAAGTNDPIGASLVAKQAASVQDWIAKVERARAKMLANPSDLQAAKAYETVQAQLNKHFKSQPQLLAAINDVLSNYNSNLKQSATNASQLGVTFQDVLQGVQSLYQNFQQTETGLMGDIFNGPFVNNPLTQNRTQFGGRLTGMDLLHDLHSQIFQFKHFHGQINNLQRRGAPQELLNQLMAAGDTTQNMQNIAALQNLSPSQLRDYFNTFNQQQKLIKSQTMKDLQNQLKIYRQHGRNIALAIIAGLRDENVNLTNTLSNMIKKMFPGLPVGSTGAGGKPTHKPASQTVKVDLNLNHTQDDKPGTPAISKKAKQRHNDIRKRNQFPIPFGGPR